MLAVLAVACVGFWIGVPLGTLWALGELTDSTATHFVAGVLGVPVAMALFSPILFWLNGLYLRVTGTLARLARRGVRAAGAARPRPAGADAVRLLRGRHGRDRVWFFLLAENPPPVV